LSPPVAPATAAALRRALLAWYDRTRRELPWRGTQSKVDPYRTWIAEVMLQQTQVAIALPYWLRFVERFPTLAALAAAREEDVLAVWSGLGYYARARRMVPAARLALARHGGLPSSVEELRGLPGFGPYTAGAVASIAFGVRTPAVDGNVTRVLSRLFLLDGDPRAPAARRRVEAIAAALLPEERPGDLNQALMDLGATVCRKPSPACSRCPVAARCRALAAGRAAEVPPPRRRAARRPMLLLRALDARAGRVLLVRRPAGGLWGGLWDLPGCDVPGGIAPASALAVALGGTFGRGVRVGPLLAEVTRTLTHRDVTLRAHACRLPAARGPGFRRVGRSEVGRLGVPAATRALLGAAWGARARVQPREIRKRA
jgi:A/G-specific adenine glycosylase